VQKGGRAHGTAGSFMLAESQMLRLLLLLLVIGLVVDAIRYDGAYVKSVWSAIVDMTDGVSDRLESETGAIMLEVAPPRLA
jgi:hypothetical protein